MYFESHAHYDDRRFHEDREELLSTLLPASGVDVIVNSGADLRTSQASMRLAEKYDYVYFAPGVHPHELYDMSEEIIAKLRRLAGHKKAVAIGEIGLDYYYDTFPRQFQKFWFRRQLRLADELNKPVIIHSRDAAADTFDIISQSNIRRGVIHCYSGGVEMAMDYVEMGYYIGIGGVLTFPNAKKLVEVAKTIPLERILIETDCPYLAPAPNRGKRNDSRNLEYIVNRIAEIRQISPEEVAFATSQNGKDLFFS